MPGILPETNTMNKGSINRTTLFSVIIMAALTALSACNNQSEEKSKSINNDSRPNVLFIVADDLGFTDLSSYGSEILTPNIDALAHQGLQFSRFYSASMCAPTRAMLLTGMDNHVTGLGNMAELMSENQRGKPGYEGYLKKELVTLPEILLNSGYHTYMVGKWHLGYEHDQSPRARGFERSLALLNGGASHYEDMGGTDIHRPKSAYREDGELISALPQGFYSSKAYTDKLIEYLEINRADSTPFFAYAAYTSPHWPLHAPDDIRDKYVGTYDEGYDVVRAKRYQSAKNVGLLPEKGTIPARPKFIPSWNSLSEEEKRIAAREMEVYAAMVADLDRNIGRLITYLKHNDLYKNTLIVFMSDNGSDGFSLTSAPDAIKQFAALHDNSLDNIGRPNSFSFIGPKWAHVGEAPFRLYKMIPTEGGIRVPAIIVLPSDRTGKKQKVNINKSVVSVMDLLPTVLDLVGLEYSGEARSASNNNRSTIKAPQGRSLLPVLSGQKNAVRNGNDVLGSELIGRRAIIKGDWKIVDLPEPLGSGQWELFNLENDPGEQVDLAGMNPEKLEEMTEEWRLYAIRNGVVLPPPGPPQVNPMHTPTR
ncbi:MAG TPA: arylsulfatase [Gammaproteobacteria bacterium]|nr:arylsulfatase [Gammaproteobacteria bacterium]